jgi:hypothetical protein
LIPTVPSNDLERLAFNDIYAKNGTVFIVEPGKSYRFTYDEFGIAKVIDVSTGESVKNGYGQNVGDVVNSLYKASDRFARLTPMNVDRFNMTLDINQSTLTSSPFTVDTDVSIWFRSTLGPFSLISFLI